MQRMKVPNGFVEEMKCTELIVPIAPNFIRTTNGIGYYTEDIDEKVLRAVGRAWTKKLIAKARKRKCQP